MQLEMCKVKCPLQLAITYRLRSQVVARLETVSPHTAVGYGLRLFSAKSPSQSDDDFRELLYDMQTALQEDPYLMKKILGDHFEYFHQLLLGEEAGVL